MRALSFGLLACLGTACHSAAERDRLSGDDPEGRRVAAIGRAFDAKDCNSVESLGKGFTSRQALRVAAISTWIGRCRYRNDRFEDAEALFRSVAGRRLAIDPYTRSAAYYLGRARLRLHRYDGAEAAFVDFVQRFPWDHAVDDAQYHRARARFRGGDPEGARALFEALLAEPSTSRLRRAGATYQLGRIDAAAAPDAEAASRAFRRFAEVQRAYADTGYVDDAAYRTGRLLFDLEAWSEAEASLAAFAADFPESGWRDGAAYYQARAVEEQRRWEEALALYGAFPGDHADSIYLDNVAYRRGRVFYRQAEEAAADAALALYRRAADELAGFLETWPDSSLRPSATYFLARARYESGEKQAALELFESVSRLESSIYADNATYYLGKTHYDLAGSAGPGALEAAIGAFDALLARFPASDYADDGAYFRARALYRLHREEAAEAAFDSVATDYPASPYVDNALYYGVLLRAARGDCEAAGATLEALRDRFPESEYLPLAERAVLACAPASR